MSTYPTRIAAVLLVVAMLAMTACSGSGPAANAHADFYWSAAKETYALGDYPKTADNLEHLIADSNPYTVRALPWYLVVTSGMSAGYIQLAERYNAGAHSKKSSAAAFYAKAAAYRTLASQWAMRFAQSADRLNEIPLGPLHVEFALPKGNGADPEALGEIASGIELEAADAENAEILTLQHAVLMAACQAVGARQDVAKAQQVLSRVPAEEPRATFGNAVADMLESQSALYSRNQLDEPAKLAALRDRAAVARKEAARVGSARIVAAANPASH